MLSSLDDRPIASSSRLLLSASSRVTNTGLQWNEARNRVLQQGGPPTLFEPLQGTIALKGVKGAKDVEATALDGAGRPFGRPIAARRSADGWSLTIGDPATTWYSVQVRR